MSEERAPYYVNGKAAPKPIRYAECTWDGSEEITQQVYAQAEARDYEQVMR